MKNLLVFSLAFASALVSSAQTTPEENDDDIVLADTDFSFVHFVSNTIRAMDTNTQIAVIDSSSSNIPRAVDVVDLHLNVFALTTQTPIDATVDIYYNSDFIKNYSGKIECGELHIPLKNFGWYIISVTSPGYFEGSDTVWVVSEQRKNIERDFYLVPIEIGMNITLNNINFNFDKSILPDQSIAELDKEVLLLNENPNIIFEIAGHTDSDGPKDYNLLLSQHRAQAVVDYLVSQGVDRAQLIARGYGETRPLKSNETKLDRANNRRVEFSVLTLDSGAVATQQIKGNLLMAMEVKGDLANENY